MNTATPIALEQPIQAAAGQALGTGKTPETKAFSSFLRGFSVSQAEALKLAQVDTQAVEALIPPGADPADALPQTGKALPLFALSETPSTRFAAIEVKPHSDTDIQAQLQFRVKANLLDSRANSESNRLSAQAIDAQLQQNTDVEFEPMDSPKEMLRMALAKTETEVDIPLGENLLSGRTTSVLALASEQGPQILTSSALNALERAQGAAGAQSTANTPVFQITPRLEEAEFSQALGQRLLLQVKDQLQFARLALNPPELGPVDVRIEVNRDVASINFVTASSQVREALEDAIPRLREQFAGAGLSLGQADVSAGEQGSGQPTSEESNEFVAPLDSEFEGLDAIESEGQRLYMLEGLVDAYA